MCSNKQIEERAWKMFKFKWENEMGKKFNLTGKTIRIAKITISVKSIFFREKETL